MKDLLTPATAQAVLAFLQTPSTYAWGILIVLGLWAVSKFFDSLTEFVKIFK